jgi:transketolase
LRPDERLAAARLAGRLRIDSIRCTTAAGSGHPTSSLSAADLMAVLQARHLVYDWSNPRHPANDHLIFSKGHASPLYYAMLRAAGAIDDPELLTFSAGGSRLHGHPTPSLPWVEVATGSLGQGLPIGVGIALAGRYLDVRSFHIWVLCGDGELAEGSMWEAFGTAAHHRLSNLTAIVDVNRLGACGPTELGWDLDRCCNRLAAFGVRPIVVDGHDLDAIDDALREARRSVDGPTAIVARTIKGMGVPDVEDADGWHGRPLPPDLARAAIESLGHDHPDCSAAQCAPPERADRDARRRSSSEPAPDVVLPAFPVGGRVSTREAYGRALAAVGVRSEVVAIDADVGRSTYTSEFERAHPDRHFQVFIAEQMLVAAAVGLSLRGYRPFASTFAAFLTRAHDFVRMAAISRADIRLVGSHAGVEVGQGGAPVMGLEDIAAFRAVPGSTVLYPCDANQTAQLVRLMVDLRGVVYMRTTRGAYPVLYPPDEPFAPGGSRVLRAGEADRVALIAAGVTVHHALVAAELLGRMGVSAAVIDLYSVKPVDTRTLRQVSAATGGRLVVAEDHYVQGGVDAAVLEALAAEPRPPRVIQCAVSEVPGSGSPGALLDAAGLSAGHIAAAARRLLD